MKKRMVMVLGSVLVLLLCGFSNDEGNPDGEIHPPIIKNGENNVN